jgi:hypothetical protein
MCRFFWMCRFLFLDAPFFLVPNLDNAAIFFFTSLWAEFLGIVLT